ncbi:MAG: phosphatase PAP2 family protein [Gammaproteobacteria bacterium]
MKSRLKLSGLLPILFLYGCGTLGNGYGWGEQATVRPGWQHAGRAAREAFLDPVTWVPLLTGSAIAVTGSDQNISDWARDHTPIFGSANAADDWSDRFNRSAQIGYFATMLATPSGAGADWWKNKGKGLLVGLTAISTNSILTSELKNGINRERPNGSDRRSLPSGHASGAAVHSALGRRNTQYLPVDTGTQHFVDIYFLAIMAGSSWARVEGGFHFPTDVLAGMALGNFLGQFFDRSFMGIGEDGLQTSFYLLPGQGHFLINLQLD